MGISKIIGSRQYREDENISHKIALGHYNMRFRKMIGVADFC
jgi:hypothetical protein